MREQGKYFVGTQKLTSSSSLTPVPASQTARMHEQVECVCTDGAGSVEHQWIGCGGSVGFGVIACLDPPSMHTAVTMLVAEDN